MARLVEDTGQYANVAQPAQIAPSPSFAEGSNLQLFNRLPTHVKSMVNSLAEGRIPLAGRSPLSKDQMSQLFEVASAIDPTLDATSFSARNRTETAFSPGGPEGQKLNSIRAAMAHLQNLEQNYNKLNNFNVGGTYLNAPINAVERFFGNKRIQSGMSGSERNIKDLSGELASAFRASGLAEADIKRELEGLNPNMATEDMRSTIENAVRDLEGKVHEKVDMYNTTMHRNKTTADFLGPTAGPVYNRILQGGALNPPKQEAPVSTQTPGQRMANALQTKIPQGISPQEWAAMSPQDKALWAR
jgi:hypothetical protein